MEQLLTTKELAAAIGASESSLRRWTNSGAIETSRTVGGHRRISLSEALRFIRSSGIAVIRPEILGLAAKPVAASNAGMEDGLFQALLDGDVEAAKAEVVSRFVHGVPLTEIFDGPVRQAMTRIGELWKHSARGIRIEHRATDICFQAVGKIRDLMPPRTAAAPVAVGGAPPGDPYFLPSLMAATVLADTGFRDINFGANTPLEGLSDAAREHAAAIVWVSVTVKSRRRGLEQELDRLAIRLRRQRRMLVVGGRAAEYLRLRERPHVHRLASMAELQTVARSISTTL